MRGWKLQNLIFSWFIIMKRPPFDCDDDPFLWIVLTLFQLWTIFLNRKFSFQWRIKTRPRLCVPVDTIYHVRSFCFCFPHPYWTQLFNKHFVPMIITQYFIQIYHINIWMKILVRNFIKPPVLLMLFQVFLWVYL